MILQVFPPPPDLLPFISGYLYGHSLFTELRHQPNIPRGMPGLMIIMGRDGGGQVEFVGNKSTAPLRNGVFLFGQATQITWMNVGLAQAYMVALKPTTLPLLLGESANAVTDTVIRLDDLLPEFRFLSEQLAAQRNQFSQLTVLDATLRQLFRNKVVHPGEVHGALHRIVQTQGQVKIDDLSVRERISTRSLTRKFTEQVGMSPKQYTRVIRFRSVMNHLLTTPGVSWLDIIHHFGYYDQSHIIKDFHLMTGHSPAHYLMLDQHFDGQFIKALSAVH